MNLQTPGIYIQEPKVAQPAQPWQLRLDVAGFVGQALRGPVNNPQMLTNWEQFRAIFGDPVGYSYLAYAVRGFFLNGGQRCYVVRVARSGSHREPLRCASFPPLRQQITRLKAAKANGANEAQVAFTQNIVPGMELEISDGSSSARVRVTAAFADPLRPRTRLAEASERHTNTVMLESIDGLTEGDEITLAHPSVLRPEKLKIKTIYRSSNEVMFTTSIRSSRGFPIGSEVYHPALIDLAGAAEQGDEIVTVSTTSGLMEGDMVSIQQPNGGYRQEFVIQAIDRQTNRITLSNQIRVAGGFPQHSRVCHSTIVRFRNTAVDRLGNALPVAGIPSGAVVSQIVLDVTAIDEGVWGNNLRLSVDDVSRGELMLAELAEAIGQYGTVARFDSVAGLMPGDTITLVHASMPIRERLTIQAIDLSTAQVMFREQIRAASGFSVGSRVFGRGFRLTVQYRPGGKLEREEVFDNLSLNPNSERYALKIVNGDDPLDAGSLQEPVNRDSYALKIVKGNSILIRLDDVNRSNGLAAPRPAGVEVQAYGGGDGIRNFGLPAHHYYTGYDGDRYLAPQTADTSDSDENLRPHVGMALFEETPEVGTVAIPDLLIPLFYANTSKEHIPDAGIIFSPHSAGSLDARQLQDIQDGQRDILWHCARMGERFAILDAPYGLDLGAGTVRIDDWPSTFQVLQDSAYGTLSQYGALYYPWIKEYQADSRVAEPFIPPSGHIAGIYARSDRARSIAKAPANEIIRGVTELETDIHDSQQAILNQIAVNCLRVFRGNGIRVWGARALNSGSNPTYINTRRVTLAVIKFARVYLLRTVFEPNDQRLRSRIVDILSVFLRSLRQEGTLVGVAPEEAYFVKCDEENNPPEIVERGELIVEFGFALTRPAEFIIVTIKQNSQAVLVDERTGT